MRWTLLAVVVALGSWWVPSSAWAGGSTGGTGGTGTGGGTSSESSSDSGPPGESGGDEQCGSCADPGESVVITSPANGTEVPADLMLAFEITYACSCDDCGCYEDPPESYSVFVDGAEAADCLDNCTGSRVEDLSLSPGTHEILVAAQYSFHSESATITVEVVGQAGTTGGSSGDSGDGGGGGGGGGGKGGCRLGTSSEGLAVTAWLLVLGVVRRGARRRRR